MTKQVLAFTERPEFKTLLEFEIKAMTGFAPVVHETLEDLENMLGLFPEVELLVVDTPNGEDRFDAFIETIKNNGSYKNIVLIGEEKQSASNMKVFQNGDVPSMLSHIRKTLGLPEDQVKEWVSIPVTCLYHFNKLPFDLYVKLSEEKFVKRIPLFEEIEDKTIAGFLEKGIQDLHFHREHNKDFSRMLINNMMEKLEVSYDSKEAALKARAEVFGTTKEIIQSLGLHSKVIEICDNLVGEITRDVLSDGGKLARYLDLLKKSNLAFHYRFIELTCYLGSQLLMALDERNHVEELRRFIFAAYFCDMTLNNDQHYHHFNPEGLKVLKGQDRREVEDHAWRAANLISKHRNAPLDIAVVIKQHHGDINGSGIPAKKSPHITNLTKCLIISQELAYGMLTNSHRPALEVLKKMMEKHKGSGLEEIVYLFEKSLAESAVQE